VTWPRRRHGDFVRISENVWRVEGAVPGMLLNRQMIVIRDPAGRLLLHSAIALDEPGMSQLEALGTPTWLVVPNGYHRLDAAAYRARFSSLVVVSPSGAIPRVQQVVAVDLTYEEFPEYPMLRFHAAPWPGPKEGVVEVRDGHRTLLVFNDLLFNPVGSGPTAGAYGWLRQGPQIPWLSKRMFARDAARLRVWFLQLADTEQLEIVIPGHGDPIAFNAPATLRAIAANI
jgi:hypothetical protein